MWRRVAIPLQRFWRIGLRHGPRYRNWDNPGFESAPDIKVRNTTISWTMPKDEGEILRITPLFQ